MLIIGVDPGKLGGVAYIQGGKLIKAKPFKGDIEICRRISYRAAIANSVFFIEQVGSSPQMGRVSAFTFGRFVEAVECAATLTGCPVHMVRPQMWQNAIGVFSQGDKQKLYEHAQKLFPEQYKAKMFNKATSDAVLITYYGWRYMVNQEA